MNFFSIEKFHIYFKTFQGSPKLNLHYKTRRWKEINPVYDRSKYIVQGENVIELGNHRVWKTKRTWSIFGTSKPITLIRLSDKKR